MDEPMTLKEYIKEKIRMLDEDFKIGYKLTDADIAELESAKSEIHCDRIARKILDKYIK